MSQRLAPRNLAPTGSTPEPEAERALKSSWIFAPIRPTKSYTATDDPLERRYCKRLRTEEPIMATDICQRHSLIMRISD